MPLLCMSACIVLESVFSRLGTYWEAWEGIVPLLALWAGQGALYFILAFILKRRSTALALTLFLTLIWFQYGEILKDFSDGKAFLVWGAVMAGGALLILRFPKVEKIAFSVLVTFAALIASYNGAMILMSYQQMRYDLKNLPKKEEFLDKKTSTASSAMPDIYVVIQDAYAFNDTLKRLFSYDNGPFLDDLRAKGFFVAEDSRSFYSQTMLSISSTMNLNYFQEDVRVPHTRFIDRRPAANYYLRPRLFKFLKDQGYDMTVLTTGYRVDPTFNPKVMDIRAPNFEATVAMHLMVRTPVYRILDSIFGNRRTFLNPYYSRYQTVQKEYGDLRAAAEKQSDMPKFVYAHVLAPHPPFVFSADGGFADYNYHVPFSYTDGAFHAYSHLFPKGWEDFYRQAYIAQLRYVNAELEQFINLVQAQKDGRPKVIIIQGDHGSRMEEYFESAEHSDIQEVFGILNLIYFSDGDYAHLTKDIGPVNVMRAMIDKYFGIALPLLPERHWFSTWSRPYEFIDVTQKADGRVFRDED